MSLKTFVKIGNVTNLSDARYCAGMGVDVIGFPVDASIDHALSSEKFAEITNWISGIGLVGEFKSAGLEEIKLSLQNFQLDFIEIQQIDLVESVALLGKPVYFKTTIVDESAFNSLKSKLSYLDELVGAVIVQSGNTALFESLDEFHQFYNGNVRLIKGYGVEEASPESLSKFKGIELQATEEERPGYKDYGQVMDILESLEED